MDGDAVCEEFVKREILEEGSEVEGVMSKDDAYGRLQAQIARLEAYLHVQLERRDWHAVSDVACDLRVLEAELGMIVKIRGGEKA